MSNTHHLKCPIDGPPPQLFESMGTVIFVTVWSFFSNAKFFTDLYSLNLTN